MAVMKRIAIIGGGPAGLAAAKALALEPAQFTVDLFERRDNIGGVWLYRGDKSKVLPSVPSTDPNGREVLLPAGGFENRFFSSMYQYLETNLIDKLMEFSQVPFEPRTMNFIDRTEVLQYLERYAKTIPETVNVSLDTNVLDIDKKSGDSKWTVITESVSSLDKTTRQYDAVVVANGHSELPYIPDTPGLTEWSARDPFSVTHSKYFVSSSGFKNDTVLIIGNYASGMDLATQISTTAKQVYVSTKDETVKPSDYPYIEQVRLITKYDVSTRSAYTIDGLVLSNIDRIVFCTGYLYTLPFLHNHAPQITDGTSVKDLYKQVFNVDDPSLSFIGLPKFVSPLPLCESQSAIVARALSGRITLPATSEMRSSYEEELKAKGGGKNFHSFKDCDFTYCNELYDWVKQAGTEKEGLLPLFWDEQQISERSNVVNLKKERAEFIAKYAAKLRAEGREFKFPDRDQ
ncbi:hypothetical protein JCM33374_g3083 [Metschnikowia sp. JCM 33374]|nr:hypothetical protein JCM33374_g3083 [Metschnikowia sp. JCM 33374]